MRSVLLIGLLAMLFALPVCVLVLYSLAPGWSFPHLWPQDISFKAFSVASNQSSQIIRAIGSSMAFSLSTALLTLLMCFVPAATFARTDFRGKHLLEGLLLTPALVPPMTFAMGLHFLFIKIGLADTFFGVVLVLAIFSYPYMLRSLVTGFYVLGQKHRMCARNLGAGWWRITWGIELPLLVPSIVAGGSVVFLVAFSEYFLVFLIGGGTVPSFTGTLFPLLNSSNRALASILTLIFLTLPILLFMLVDLSLNRIYRKKGLLSDDPLLN